ncbi:hypothetical protein PPTG_20963 [Phytophthora nicotianae INRA-310]|uniref:Uncharacterized protein n=3 Tax=Phytophthora nicotianae TaxID=4792 RepID=W2REK8_PHYN3|nr:hypothetical protein PPTG_20963 [Phytophthora nicotianae INRA-310]ETI49593.1 hypothetical protein F443_06606 [Phytophthora nicotianae P1569]ETN22975.1 hypothetical protein PPTG_20963 [Phytophthora nicotianae INRA-310]ETO78308.1 hypothetical protein F444_06678 [Phytophthora nicotianae P1976]
MVRLEALKSAHHVMFEFAVVRRTAAGAMLLFITNNILVSSQESRITRSLLFVRMQCPFGKVLTLLQCSSPPAKRLSFFSSAPRQSFKCRTSAVFPSEDEGRLTDGQPSHRFGVDYEL